MTKVYSVIFCHFVFLNLLLTLKIVLTDESMVTCDAGSCDKGEFFEIQTKNCQPCSNGTYNDMSNHSCLSCKACSEADHYDAEVVVENCTGTSDTVIVCQPGHFNAQDDVEFSTDCEACSVCGENEVLVQACSNTSDTVCLQNATKTEPTPESDPTPDSVHKVDRHVTVALLVSLMVAAAVVILIFILYKRIFKLHFKGIKNMLFSQRDENDVSFTKLENEERNI